MEYLCDAQYIPERDVIYIYIRLEHLCKVHTVSAKDVTVRRQYEQLCNVEMMSEREPVQYSGHTYKLLQSEQMITTQNT